MLQYKQNHSLVASCSQCYVSVTQSPLRDLESPGNLCGGAETHASGTSLFHTLLQSGEGGAEWHSALLCFDSEVTLAPAYWPDL